MIMKKIILICIIIIIILTVVLPRGKKVVVNADDEVIIQFLNSENRIERHQLEEDDRQTILSIIRGRKEYRENYSCGFSDELSFQVNGKSYYLAFDGCPNVYDKTEDLYFSISKEEKAEIAAIYSQYGGVVFY